MNTPPPEQPNTEKPIEEIEFDEVPEEYRYTDQDSEPAIKIFGRRIPLTLARVSEIYLAGMLLILLLGCGLCYLFVILPGSK